MSNANVQENESRKKYLAPIIVLLLCLVSLTGAAYAYSSSVTTHGTATANEFFVELYTSDAGSTASTLPVAIPGSDVVTFTTDMDYDENTVTVKANPDNKNVAIAYLKVNSNVPNQTNAKIKFESDLVTLQAPALCVGMTLQASVFSVVQGGETIVKDGEGYYTVDVNSTITMTIFLTVSGTLEWDSTTATYATAEAAADAFHDDFEDKAQFKFKVTAENIVATP